MLFTENDTNFNRLWGVPNKSPYVKDGFHDHIVPAHRPPSVNSHMKTNGNSHNGNGNGNGHGNGNGTSSGSSSDEERGPPTPRSEPIFVNPAKTGTKSAAHYTFTNVPGKGGCAVVRMKLTPQTPQKDPTLEDEGLFDDAIEERRLESDEFYATLVQAPMSDDLRAIMRQALSGMMWTKQYYQFIPKDWLEGDAAQPPPPPERKWRTSNRVSAILRGFYFAAHTHTWTQEWKHFHAADILSMPDK